MQVLTGMSAVHWATVERLHKQMMWEWVNAGHDQRPKGCDV